MQQDDIKKNVDPYDPTGAAKAGELTRLRIKFTGDPNDTIVEAYRGDVRVPLDVDSIQFFVDYKQGKVTLSWPASCVDFEIDVEKRKHFLCLGCGTRVDVLNARCQGCAPLVDLRIALTEALDIAERNVFVPDPNQPECWSGTVTIDSGAQYREKSRIAELRKLIP